MKLLALLVAALFGAPALMPVQAKPQYAHPYNAKKFKLKKLKAKKTTKARRRTVVRHGII